jgi:flavin reductase ActVB
VTAQQEVAPAPAHLFTEAMARLVSGVAVVTARRADGAPCGLLVSSLCSYSADPPSVLVSVGTASRSFGPLVTSAEFGVHLLGRAHEELAGVFAGRGDDKFAHHPWAWDGAVPHLRGVPVYLACATRAVFHHGDHAILVGEVATGYVQPAEPLVYYRRRLGWRLGGRLRGADLTGG